ncbi:type II secretion system protein GspM [Achromobacter insuavis]
MRRRPQAANRRSAHDPGAAARPLGLPALWRSRWRARQQAWQGGRAAWSGLADNERRLLALCAAVVAAAGCWLAVIEPSLARADRGAEELRRLETNARDLEAVLRQAGPAPAARQAAVSPRRWAAGSTRPDWQGATNSAPTSAAGAWRIVFHRAPAAPLAAWLLAGPAPFPLALTRVALQRQDQAEPGDPRWRRAKAWRASCC